MEIKLMHPASITDMIHHPNEMGLWHCKSMCHRRRRLHPQQAATIPAKLKIAIGVHLRIEMIL